MRSTIEAHVFKVKGYTECGEQ